MLEVKVASICTTARRRRCATSRFMPTGEVTCVLGRNGVGKTSLLERSPASSRSAAARSCGKSGHHHAQALRARAARHRLCAAGARNLSAADGRGKSQDRLCAAQAQRARHPGRCVQPVSGAQRHAAPARRRPFRRPAAAACDRPRAGHAAAAAAARRADRRHPAVDHQGHRPCHHLPALARKSRSCWWSSISISRASSATVSW